MYNFSSHVIQFERFRFWYVFLKNYTHFPNFHFVRAHMKEKVVYLQLILATNIECSIFILISFVMMRTNWGETQPE
jgi:hypothetical protein